MKHCIDLPLTFGIPGQITLRSPGEARYSRHMSLRWRVAISRDVPGVSLKDPSVQLRRYRITPTHQLPSQIVREIHSAMVERLLQPKTVLQLYLGRVPTMIHMPYYAKSYPILLEGWRGLKRIQRNLT